MEDRWGWRSARWRRQRKERNKKGVKCGEDVLT
jgi:hypothetical protein